MATPGGKVFLIGAGPGDPELITVRGKRLLEMCTAVVYDNLVPSELIVSLHDDVEKVYVGKKAGDHALHQDGINQLLVKLAREGHLVGRLKGADPLIFGRGSEEAAFLTEHGVPFEIVPGVTAAIGAAAYAGMPCTDRRHASFVVFATGHKAKDKDATSVPWEWLGRARNGSIVIYMGVSQVGEVVQELIAGGMDPQTPAAIVERATTPAQRVVRSVLADLSKTVADRGVRPPALFFIGQTTTLGDQIEWFGGGPLQGRRVMVLRPADQAAMFYKLLRDLGAEILPYPTIATRAVADSNWETVFNLDSPNAWLAFTSENGVRYFMRHLAECGLDQRLLGAFSIAAIGHGTKRALKEHGLTADFMPNKATVSALAHELADSGQVSEAAVVRVEGNLSDDTLPDVLGAAGAEVIRLPVYETYHPEWADGMKARLLERPPHIVMFTSGSTVHGLFECLSADEIEAVIGGATLVSIGPSTTKKIESKGLDVTVEAEEHSLPGMIQAILKHESERELQ